MMIVNQGIKMNLPVSEMKEMYMKRTGRSERSFYRDYDTALSRER